MNAKSQKKVKSLYVINSTTSQRLRSLQERIATKASTRLKEKITYHLLDHVTLILKDKYRSGDVKYFIPNIIFFFFFFC